MRTIALVLTLALLSAFVTPARAADLVLEESFESGDFGVWKADSYIPCDPGCFDWEAAIKEGIASDGAFSVFIWADGGPHDDGTVWVETAVPRPEEIGWYRVTVSFDLHSWDVDEVNPSYVVAFAGTFDPETEEQLPRIGFTNEVEGWKRYTLEQDVEITSSTELVWVAAGYSIVWEGADEHFVDLITVAWEPIIHV